MVAAAAGSGGGCRGLPGPTQGAHLAAPTACEPRRRPISAATPRSRWPGGPVGGGPARGGAATPSALSPLIRTECRACASPGRPMGCLLSAPARVQLLPGPSDASCRPRFEFQTRNRSWVARLLAVLPSPPPAAQRAAAAVASPDPSSCDCGKLPLLCSYCSSS